MELPNPAFLSSITRVVVISFAAIVALDQIGIATALVNALFYGIVAALALGVGLAFGLGGRDVTTHIWQRWYARTSDLGTRLEHRARTRAAHAQATQTAPAAQQVPLGARPVRRTTS